MALNCTAQPQFLKLSSSSTTSPLLQIDSLHHKQCKIPSSSSTTTISSLLHIDSLHHKQCRVPYHHSLALSTKTSYFVSGSYGVSAFDPLLLAPRFSRRAANNHVANVKAAFLWDLIRDIIRFFVKVPGYLFLQKVEADVDKAAKIIKTGASIAAEVAKEVDEFAEKIESAAEKTEEIAETVLQTTDKIEHHIDDIIDLVKGGKHRPSSESPNSQDEKAVT